MLLLLSLFRNFYGLISQESLMITTLAHFTTTTIVPYAHVHHANQSEKFYNYLRFKLPVKVSYLSYLMLNEPLKSTHFTFINAFIVFHEHGMGNLLTFFLMFYIFYLFYIICKN